MTADLWINCGLLLDSSDVNKASDIKAKAKARRRKAKAKDSIFIMSEICMALSLTTIFIKKINVSK